MTFLACNDDSPSGVGDGVFDGLQPFGGDFVAGSDQVKFPICCTCDGLIKAWNWFDCVTDIEPFADSSPDIDGEAFEVLIDLI